MGKSEIKYLTLSQEDLVNAGAFDLKLAIAALKDSLFKFKNDCWLCVFYMHVQVMYILFIPKCMTREKDKI